jgi:hypothetical protein
MSDDGGKRQLDGLGNRFHAHAAPLSSRRRCRLAYVERAGPLNVAGEGDNQKLIFMGLYDDNCLS